MTPEQPPLHELVRYIDRARQLRAEMLIPLLRLGWPAVWNSPLAAARWLGRKLSHLALSRPPAG